MSRSDVLTLADHLDERTRVTRTDRLVRWVCVTGAAACICAAGALLPAIQTQRIELELVVGENAYDDAPPGIALPTIMLSTFRGLVVQILWMRTEELKAESKYFELQQLYEWICNLQPRYPKVWESAAWNLAYNVSVGTFSERERWHWVSAGAWLLRDKGIPMNPRTINLYKELSWIYLHKMGDFMDDKHWAYKRNWGVIMERVLGQPPAEPEDSQVMDAMRTISEAAGAIRGFGVLGSAGALQLYINHDTEKPAMGDFVARLEDIGFGPDERWLEAVARYDRHGVQLSDLLADSTALPEERSEAFMAVMADPKPASARDRLLAAVRAHVLGGSLKLDPVFMYELMDRFGPLDWRTVYSHGLYWAAKGAKECSTTIGKDVDVEMNTNRFIQFGLKDTCERGRLVFEPDFQDPFKSFIDLLPDYRFADVLHDLYLEQAEALRGDEDPEEYYKEGPAGRLFKSGHVNFLHTVVRRLFLEGRNRKAQHYYDYLRENYLEPNGKTKDIYLTTMEEFALRDYFSDMESFRQGPVLINTMLHSALLNLVYGRAKEAGRRLGFAKQGYDRYMDVMGNDRNERRKIAPWPDLKASAFQDFLLRYPLPSRYNLTYKARAWKLMSTQDKLRIYRGVEQGLREACKVNVPEIDFAKAFPPPPGLEEYEAGVEKKPVEGEEQDIRDVKTDDGFGR